WSTSISQTIIIPQGSATIALTYDTTAWMYTAHGAAAPGGVTVSATVGGVTTSLESYPIATYATPVMDAFVWTKRSIDVTAFRGKAVTLTWTNVLTPPSDQTTVYGDIFCL